MWFFYVLFFNKKFLKMIKMAEDNEYDCEPTELDI